MEPGGSLALKRVHRAEVGERCSGNLWGTARGWALCSSLRSTERAEMSAAWLESGEHPLRDSRFLIWLKASLKGHSCSRNRLGSGTFSDLGSRVQVCAVCVWVVVVSLLRCLAACAGGAWPLSSRA